jgi:putative endonuclease
MFTVYAIKSISYNFIYVGITENLCQRLNRHNKGYNRSTKKFAPFELFYSENCSNGSEAREREKFLKSTSGKRLLRSILINQNNIAGIGR